METKELHSEQKILSYKLCNETGLKYKSNIYDLIYPLDNLYCINMNNLYIGGSLQSEHFYNIRFDLNLCKDDIDYDENNESCTSISKLEKIIGNNSWEFEVFFPKIEFEPDNFTNPIFVNYIKNCYTLSKYSYRIDKFYFKENLFFDQKNIFFKNMKNSSYWGLNKIKSNDYVSLKKDLAKGASTSRLYCMFIYLDSGYFLIKREYKSIFELLSDAFPYMTLIWIVIKYITKIIKYSIIQKILSEILFINIEPIKPYNSIKISGFDKKSNINNNLKDIKLDDKINDADSYLKENSKNELLNVNKKLATFSKIEEENKSLELAKLDLKEQIKTKKKKFFPKSNKNISQSNIVEENMNKIKTELYGNRKIKNIMLTNKEYLFKTFYYIIDALYDSFYITNKGKLIPKKYLNILDFTNKIMDVTSYINLFKQFNIMKHISMTEKNLRLVETEHKININEEKFMSNLLDENENSFKIFLESIKK